MTKQERENKLIDLKARQLMKQRQLDELNPEASTEETINAIVEEIKVIQEEIAEIEKVVPTEEVPTEEVPAEAEQKAEDEEISQEEIDEENESLKEEEERRKMAKNEIRKVTIETAEERAEKIKAREERAKNLMEGRSITIAASEILVPTHQATELVDTPYKQFSDVVDAVDSLSVDGGESLQFAFVKSYGTAGLTNEGEEYHEEDPVTDYDTIAKAKLTIYTEVSEEALKLPKLDYEKVVMKNLDVAMKKKFAQQITAGSGELNTFRGITASGIKALETADDISIETIDKYTLKKIIYAHAGDEEIYGGGVLQMHKLTLKDFDEVYNSERGDWEYKIDYKAQTINGIPYIINNNLPAFSKATDDQVAIIYGSPKAYQVVTYSPVTVEKSTDFKFKTGMVCYKASVFAGGNVVGYRGFVRVKKGATV